MSWALQFTLPVHCCISTRHTFSQLCQLHTHTHTHPFNGPFFGTTRVSRYQKSKTNLDFTEARDSEWQWHQLGHMQVCTSLQTDNHTSTPPLSFIQAGCPSCHPANSVKAEGIYLYITARIIHGRLYGTVRCPSVRLSVCPVYRPLHAGAAGLLLCARRTEHIDRSIAAGCRSSTAPSSRCEQCHFVS